MNGFLIRFAFGVVPQLGGALPPEGNFDFNVETSAYSEPAGEGPFDFKVEV